MARDRTGWTEHDEASLARRAAEGEREALAELYRRLWGWSVVTARRLCHTYSIWSAEDEDVAQVAWLALLRGISTYQHPRPVRPWLRAILRHEAMRIARRERWGRAVHRSIDPPPIRGPDDQSSDLLTLIAEQMPDMPPGERQALVETAGLRPPDSQVSAAARRARLLRARRRLRAEARRRGLL